MNQYADPLPARMARFGVRVAVLFALFGGLAFLIWMLSPMLYFAAQHYAVGELTAGGYTPIEAKMISMVFGLAFILGFYSIMKIKWPWSKDRKWLPRGYAMLFLVISLTFCLNLVIWNGQRGARFTPTGQPLVGVTQSPFRSEGSPSQLERGH